MYIRIFETISTKDVVRTRKAQQKNTFFSTYSNSNFLFEEFFEKTTKKPVFGVANKKEKKNFIVREEVGPYTFSKYSFSNTCYKLYFELNVWLKNYVALATFTTQVYGKVRTKIFADMLNK